MVLGVYVEGPRGRRVLLASEQIVIEKGFSEVDNRFPVDLLWHCGK